MQAFPQTGLALFKNQIDVSQEIAQATLESAEKAEKLLFAAARQNFEDQLKFAQALAAARDPKSVAQLQGAMFGHNPQRAQQYQKQVLEIIMEANAAYGHALQTYLKGITESANAATASVAKPNPVSGGVFPMWEAAFKEFTRNASQLMQLAGNAQAGAVAVARPQQARAR